MNINGLWMMDPNGSHNLSFTYTDTNLHTFLVGGCIPTPLKNMNVNWDDEIPNIWENKIKLMATKPPTRFIWYITYYFYVRFPNQPTDRFPTSRQNQLVRFTCPGPRRSQDTARWDRPCPGWFGGLSMVFLRCLERGGVQFHKKKVWEPIHKY